MHSVTTTRKCLAIQRKLCAPKEAVKVLDMSFQDLGMSMITRGTQLV